MALKFNQQTGSAKSSNLDLYKYTDGDNTFRLVGDIIPRYLYWLKTEDGKQLPFECLAFDRETETWARAEKDWVRDLWDSDAKASWSYATQCLVNGPSGPELKVLPLKKKLWEQIIAAAEDLGDPTDPDNGWDIRFKRVKNGPLAYNVEYTLQTVKIMKEGTRPLTDEERELTKSLKSMDEIFPRETPDGQRKRLEGMMEQPTTSKEEEADLEDEFNVD